MKKRDTGKSQVDRDYTGEDLESSWGFFYSKGTVDIFLISVFLFLILNCLVLLPLTICYHNMVIIWYHNEQIIVTISGCGLYL